MKETGISKRWIASLFCVFVSLFCVVANLSAASGKEGGETLTVGIPANRCPIFYQDPKTNEIVGIGVDLMRSAAAKTGYHVTFQFVKEKNLKDALDNKSYDLVLPFGSAITGSSGHPSIVSDPFMQTPFTLVTRERHEAPPLNKLRVGMLRSLGGVGETIHQLYPGIRITMYETMAESVDALREGKVDALLNNSYVWSYVLQKPSYSDLAVQPAAVFSVDFRAGTLDTSRGRAIIERLNSGIAALSDMRHRAIILDYTSRKLYRYNIFDYLYEYGLVILLAVLLLASLIVIFVMKQRALRMEQEERMHRLMDHDPLTGLLSMSGFRKRVEELLRAHPDTPYFLSYNNIRDFKFINESLGREAGDELLKFWAKKSLENLSDEEAIGRAASDRFIVLRRIESEEKMQLDKKNVLDPVQNYFISQGKEKQAQICSGIYVLTPEDFRNIDVDRMLDYARLAEQKVRGSRIVDYAFYNPEQWEKGKHVAEVINYLPAAIQSKDLKVWYQPQVDYTTGKIIGAEALCRWAHTKLGCLQPADFICTLEKTGLIYDLDSFVWEKVCQDLRRWNEQGIRQSVSVNLSRCDVREGRDLAGHFQNLIRTYGLTPDQLRIEITETAYAENPDLLISTTETLRECGFKVEMDDFGSGYSSLNMLKEVPVNRIKLDLRFLTNKGDAEKARIIISHMIQMVRSLGMELIAEGVETVEQAGFLQSQGCTEMQGFLFYKPMTMHQFEKLFKVESKNK